MIRAFVLVAALLTMATQAFGATHSIGGGLHYLHNLGDIKDTGAVDLGLTEDSYGIIGSYQLSPGLLKFEGDVEYIFNYIGTDKGLVEPSAWGLVGGLIYGGAGIGIGYFDGKWMNDPWYSLRAGTDIPLSNLDLDVFAAYRFQKAGDLENAIDNLDSITFAAILRFGIGGR